MEAKELRIGNYIDVPGKNTVGAVVSVVHSLNNMSVYLGGLHVPDSIKGETVKYHECEGIPLTPEWLEWLGFPETLQTWNDGSKATIFRKGKYFLERLLHDETTFALARINTTGGEFMANVNYIHQLQNLYFALTGEELNLNVELHE